MLTALRKHAKRYVKYGLYFITDVIQPEKVPKLFMQGAIIAALFSPLAVLINGKMKEDETQQEPDKRLDMPWREWVWKLIMIAIVYIVIYISFGAFVFRPLAGSIFSPVNRVVWKQTKNADDDVFNVTEVNTKESFRDCEMLNLKGGD